jgi:N-acetyltransferase 10
MEISSAAPAGEGSRLLTEQLGPRKNLPPLLLKLSERPPEVPLCPSSLSLSLSPSAVIPSALSMRVTPPQKLHYLGVSYGLTEPLLKFWKKSGYIPVYIRQTSVRPQR